MTPKHLIHLVVEADILEELLNLKRVRYFSFLSVAQALEMQEVLMDRQEVVEVLIFAFKMALGTISRASKHELL